VLLFGRGADHGILEVGEIQGARSQEGGFCCGGDGEVLQQPVDQIVSLLAVPVLGDEIVQGSEHMGGDASVLVDEGEIEDLGRGGVMGLTLLDDIEQHVEVEHEFHRCLSTVEARDAAPKVIVHTRQA